MTKQRRSVSNGQLTMALCGLFSLVAGGLWASSVYDDCVWFFNGGTDGFGGKAVDQVVQQGEIADELHRGTASHANHQALPQGLAMSFTREKVPLHAQGVGTQEVSCAKLNHTYSVVPGEGGTATTNFGFSTLKMPFLGDYCTNGNYSAIFRIRRDAANPFKETSWFMNFGCTGDNGFLLGFNSAGAIALHANNRAAATGGLPSTAVPVGRWVEIGVVVKGNVIWFYEAFPGSVSSGVWSDYTQCKISTYTAWKDTAKTIPKDYTMYPSYIFMGGQETKSATSMVRDRSHDNTIKFAPITIQRVAFWNRSLTPSEVAEAFAFPRPGLFTLGAANGSADEFTAAAAATKTINAARVEEPMQDVPKQLCAGDVWTVNFTAKADDALNQLLVFTATPGSPSAMLSVSLNGRIIDAGVALPAGGKCVVPIRAKYFTQGTAGSKTRLANCADDSPDGCGAAGRCGCRVAGRFVERGRARWQWRRFVCLERK